MDDSSNLNCAEFPDENLPKVEKCIFLKKKLHSLESKILELKNLLYNRQRMWLQQVKDVSNHIKSFSQI